MVRPGRTSPTQCKPRDGVLPRDCGESPLHPEASQDMSWALNAGSKEHHPRALTAQVSWAEAKELRGDGWVPVVPARPWASWTSFPVKLDTPLQCQESKSHANKQRKASGLGT